MKKVLSVVVLAMAMTVGLGACRSTPRATDAERLAFYEAHAGDPVRSFRMFGRLNGWTPLGNRAMVAWTRPNEAWLLNFAGPCQDLQFASAITISSFSSTVTARFDTVTPVLAHIQSGKLRALAVTTNKRSAALPDVPTMEEAGLKPFDMGTWFGVLAPAAAPKDVVDRLNAEMVKIIRSPDFSRRMAEIGAVPIGDSPAEMKARIGADTENYAKLVKDAKVAIN